MAYSLDYAPGWDKCFSKLDYTVQERIYKKILHLKAEIKGRHLQHGLPFFVEEVGGYRIAYKTDENAKTRKLYFAGSHKDYEKWYRGDK